MILECMWRVVCKAERRAWLPWIFTIKLYQGGSSNNLSQSMYRPHWNIHERGEVVVCVVVIR